MSYEIKIVKSAKISLSGYDIASFVNIIGPAFSGRVDLLSENLIKLYESIKDVLMKSYHSIEIDFTIKFDLSMSDLQSLFNTNEYYLSIEANRNEPLLVEFFADLENTFSNKQDEES